ncbi:YlbL family protein [Gordonia hirsuta]|uniref:YlbL family protein n=1 Tax=Gordonia hirsuta TaxID=53427 RepID=UPI00046279B5|nr:PDZ domain-containing protein [Gordonia hirsuta]
MRLNPSRRRWITLAVAAVITIAFVIVGSNVRVPYVLLNPGLTVNTIGTIDGKPVVQVTGGVDEDPTGHLNLTTVSVTDGLTLFDALGIWATGNGQLQPRELYFPPDRSRESVQEENKQQMVDSESNATGAALTYLKRPTAAGIGPIADNSPAAGKLETGDVVKAVDGKDVASPAEFVEQIRTRKPGETVAVTVDRGGDRKVVEVTLGARADDPGQGFLGVTAKVVSADPAVTITYNVGAIGGPSAGLMLSLAVVDYLTPENLADGRFIAGTGTIVPDGTVGRIGGITHKLKGARADGATVFLVPADNCAEALTDVPDGLELIKVDTLGGAVEALKALRTGASRPHC